MDSFSLKLVAYLVGSLAGFITWTILKDRASNLPIGPPGLPIVGNMFSMGDALLHFKLTEWFHKYGDFYCYKIGRNPVIVVSSPEAVNDLFTKRGGKYSSRPKLSNQASLITQNARIVAQPYGDQWRKHRKLYHDLLGMQNSKIFLPFQEYESRRTLKNLLEEPETFWKEVTRYSASVTFSMLIGCRFDKADSLIPQQINKRMGMMFKYITPGAWLVDWFPFLDYLPDSMAPWRASAVSIRDQIMPFFGIFYRVMKERVQNGTAPACFLARVLQEEGSKVDEVEPPHIIATTMAAGTDTTATTLKWFFKAAVLFPEAIERAQEEIDRVVGRERLPDWQDRPHLPYIAAVINETHRWATVAPLAFVHATSDADVYRGKNVPSGASVYGNVYAIHNNPNTFAKPEQWIPERYLREDDQRASPDLNRAGMHYAYGLGRRECPGKHVADASLYIVISRILWAFDVVGNPGKPPVAGYTGGPIFGPAKFGTSMRLRDEAAKQIICEAAETNRPAEVEDSTAYEKLTAGLI